MRLGKKATKETGTFMAYACTCNCLSYCGNCTNCQTIAKASGTAITRDLNSNNTTYNTAGSLVLMG